MQIIVGSGIEGSFHGFESGRGYKLVNDQIWEQAEYKYLYHYAYRPKPKLWKNAGTIFFI